LIRSLKSRVVTVLRGESTFLGLRATIRPFALGLLSLATIAAQEGASDFKHSSFF